MKWKKEGGGFEVWLDEHRRISIRRVDDRFWLWWCDDMRDDRYCTATGYAHTKAEVQRRAVAVATAIGWVKP